MAPEKRQTTYHFFVGNVSIYRLYGMKADTRNKTAFSHFSFIVITMKLHAGRSQRERGR